MRCFALVSLRLLFRAAATTAENPGNCHNDEKWICPLIKKTLFTCSDKHKTVTELSNELTAREREGEETEEREEEREGG